MSARQTMGALLTEQGPPRDSAMHCVPVSLPAARAVLFLAGRFERAAELYREDLSLFPKNPWALAGLKRSYPATGDARLAETEAVLRPALELADVPIGASCACAKTHCA